MFRLSIFVLFAAAVLAALLHISIWFALVPLAAFVIYAYTFGGMRATCPYCGSGVNIGYTVCRRCGRNVARRPITPSQLWRQLRGEEELRGFDQPERSEDDPPR